MTVIHMHDTFIDPTPKALHRLLVSTGVLPDEPYCSLGTDQQMGLVLAARALKQGPSEYFNLEELRDYHEEAMYQAEREIAREEAKRETDEERREAVRSTDAAFANALGEP